MTNDPTAFNPKLTLAKIHISPSLSDETTAFTADILIDGKKAGSAENRGNGGCNSYWFTQGYPMQDKLEAWARTQPVAFPESEALDQVISDLLEDYEIEKSLKRWTKTKVVVKYANHKAGEWATYAIAFSEGFKAKLLARPEGKDIILIANEDIAKAAKYDAKQARDQNNAEAANFRALVAARKA